jgi:hypothetical protein
MVASLLLVAAVNKLAAPHVMATAVEELLPRRLPLPSALGVRAFAIGEILVATLLLVPQTRVVGGYLACALGVAFAAAGLLGALKATTTSCGCLGGLGDKPLGVRNILAGLAVIAAALVAISISVEGVRTTQYMGRSTLLCSLLVIAICLWINHSRLSVALRAIRD